MEALLDDPTIDRELQLAAYVRRAQVNLEEGAVASARQDVEAARNLCHLNAKYDDRVDSLEREIAWAANDLEAVRRYLARPVRRRAAVAYSRRGSDWLALGEGTIAIDHYREAHALAEHGDDKYTALIGLSAGYASLGETASANKFAQDARDIRSHERPVSERFRQSIDSRESSTFYAHDLESAVRDAIRLGWPRTENLAAPSVATLVKPLMQSLFRARTAASIQRGIVASLQFGVAPGEKDLAPEDVAILAADETRLQWCKASMSDNVQNWPPHIARVRDIIALKCLALLDDDSISNAVHRLILTPLRSLQSLETEERTRLEHIS